MRTRALPILLIPLLAATAAATGVQVGVDPSLSGGMAVVDAHTPVSGTATWTVEVENNGSVPFSGRVRLDVGGDGTDFRAWTDRFVLQPGAATDRTLAFRDPALNGTATAAFTLHYGARRQGPVTDRFRAGGDPGDGYDVATARAFPGYLSLGLRMPADAQEVYVTVDGGAVHRFPQRRIEDAGPVAYVRVPHAASVEDGARLPVTVVDGQGRFHRETVEVVRVRGVRAAVWSYLEAALGRVHVFLM